MLVSEVMLQQTQAPRVIEPWRRFLATFPTARSCADADLAEVLRSWRGLGYPRRAKALHEAARAIRDQFAGQVPSDVASLRGLPGVGDYTAHAVASFAFAVPVAVLDTNVGRVLARAVANRTLRSNEAKALASTLLPRAGSAAFNQAMIDLGAQFCRARPRCESCPLERCCAWRRLGGEDPAPKSAAVSRVQSPYRGSDRELRGRVLRALEDGPMPLRRLASVLAEVEAPRRAALVTSLERDGLVTRNAGTLALGTS